MTLYDLNNRRFLQNVYSTDQIDDYIERMIESIQQRRPIREHPKLEVWEPPHYRIGTWYAVGETEVGPAITVGALVEVGVWLTIALGLFGSGPDPERNHVIEAIRGRPDAVRVYATYAAILHFAGELLLYANNFERRSPPQPASDVPASGTK